MHDHEVAFRTGESKRDSHRVLTLDSAGRDFYRQRKAGSQLLRRVPHPRILREW